MEMATAEITCHGEACPAFRYLTSEIASQKRDMEDFAHRLVGENEIRMDAERKLRESDQIRTSRRKGKQLGSTSVCWCFQIISNGFQTILTLYYFPETVIES